MDISCEEKCQISRSQAYNQKPGPVSPDQGKRTEEDQVVLYEVHWERNRGFARETGGGVANPAWRHPRKINSFAHLFPLGSLFFVIVHDPPNRDPIPCMAKIGTVVYVLTYVRKTDPWYYFAIDE